MASDSTTLFRIPNEFADQLKRLADTLGQTVGEVIRDVLAEHKETGVLDRDIRGVSSSIVAKAIVFWITADDGSQMSFQRLDAKAARSLAKQIDIVAGNGGGREVTLAADKMKIAKVGRALVFVQG